MIELANDPKSRSLSHAAATATEAGRDSEAGTRRARTGHAWPFLSRYAARPVADENSRKPAAKDSGS
jgi:hypothetical protein